MENVEDMGEGGAGPWSCRGEHGEEGQGAACGREGQDDVFLPREEVEG